MYETPFVEKLPREWRELLDQGLGVCRHCDIIKESGTPRGPRGGIRGERDYETARRMVEEAEMEADPGLFEAMEADIGGHGVTVLELFRSPMQTINIDIAGTERFCLDYGLEIPGLFELHDALRRQFMRRVELVAKAPGKYVKMLENPTLPLLGPGFYEKWLLPVYHETVKILRRHGKRLMLHLDGQLSCARDLVADSPFHMVESLTEPPEGDMTYDQCRELWPDKVLLGNINVGLYQLPADSFRKELEAKLGRAGRRAFAFEISEALPSNWRAQAPVVLDVLDRCSG